MCPQRYEYISEETNDEGKPKSAKFWAGWCEDSNVVVQYGRIGTEGTIKPKDLGSAEAAQTYLEKKTQEKIKKGYKPV